MFPVLFDSRFSLPNYGKGKLTETISCIVHEELNGDFSAELKYPINGSLYNELLTGGTVVARVPKTEDDPNAFGLFDIRGGATEIDGISTFKLYHASRRLARSVCYRKTITADYYAGAFNYSSPADWDGLIISGWGGTDMQGSITLSAPKTALSVLVGESESLVSELGGDVWFTCYRSGINVYYQSRRGADRGASVRFGVNMMSLDHTKDSTSAYNAVVPYWDDGNGQITYVTGYIVQPTTPITPVMAVPLDLSNDFDSQPTEAQMVQAARDHLDNLQPWLGEETIRVDFVNDITDPHAPEILLGDTIHVYWGDADIATDLRVVAYDYDVLAERYISLELGTPQTQYVAVTGESYAGASGGGGSAPAGAVDFSSQCTFPKGDPAHFSAFALGGLAFISYQGPAASNYATQQVLVTLPTDYAFDYQTYGQQHNYCSFNTAALGTVFVGSENNGRNITLNQKATTSGNVRCYFQICYPIKK